MSMGRATCPPLWAAALGAAQPCGVSLTTRGIAPACLRYDASPLWLELRGRSAWQATPSWTVYRLACHRLLPLRRVTFAMVPDAAWPGSDQWPWSTAPATGPVGRLGRPSVSDPWGVGSFLSLGRSTCVQCPGPIGSCSLVFPRGMLLCVCGVLGHLAPVHRCARSVGCVVCAVSWATWLLFTGAPARCVVLCVRCPRPPGSCSPVCPLGVLLCVCGVLGHLATVPRCARVVCCVECAVSWAAWLPFTGVPAQWVVLYVRCPGHLAPVHRCACSLCCVVCAVSCATWLLLTGVPARCVVLRVRCPGPPGSCSPPCPLCVLVARVVSWATWLLFTGVPARCVALRVRCPGPLGSCSLVFPRGMLLCVCGVLGRLAPVHRCARSVGCVVCAVSWPPGSCSPVRPLGVLCCLCGVLGHLAPVHRCAPSVRCSACAVSWATWLPLTSVPARCVVLCVRSPGPLGSCSPVCPLGVLFCVCAVLGHLAPVHRCARSVCCVACTVSWASWLLFTGVLARCAVLHVPCPAPLGSCSLVCPLGVLFCVCGVLGHLAPVHRCARSVCCVACALSCATWLLFTGVPAQFVVLRVRCPGPPGSCSPLCPLCVLVARVVSWATWLLFTGVPARCVALRVRCPGPLGSCSPVCLRGLLC